MGLENPKILKTWFRNNASDATMWDEISNQLVSFGLRTNNNLKQLGLDINGATYAFNNQGVATQTTPIVQRLDGLEGSQAFGFSGLGLDISTESVVALASDDATALSTTNTGSFFFNSSTSVGQVKRVTFTANQSVTLTGAHWGFGTLGDRTDEILWVVLIHTAASTAVLGVTLRGGREIIPSTDCTTVQTSATSATKILTASTVAAGTYNMSHIAWIKANFDDTGGGGGEDYWAIQNGVGDTNLGIYGTYFEGAVIF